MTELAIPVKEAARRLGVGTTTLYKLFALGKITPRKFVGRTMVPIAELERYLADSPVFESRGLYGEGNNTCAK